MKRLILDWVTFPRCGFWVGPTTEGPGIAFGFGFGVGYILWGRDTLA